MGKNNQLMLLLDFNEDRSVFASQNQTKEALLNEVSTLSMDDTEIIQNTEAKVHIDTLSSFKGFGGRILKMTAAKKMTVSNDFLNMNYEDRECEVQPYEECRTRRLAEECKCDTMAMYSVQVKS